MASADLQVPNACNADPGELSAIDLASIRSIWDDHDAAAAKPRQQQHPQFRNRMQQQQQQTHHHKLFHATKSPYEGGGAGDSTATGLLRPTSAALYDRSSADGKGVNGGGLLMSSSSGGGYRNLRDLTMPLSKAFAGGYDSGSRVASSRYSSTCGAPKNRHYSSSDTGSGLLLNDNNMSLAGSLSLCLDQLPTSASSSSPTSGSPGSFSGAAYGNHSNRSSVSSLWDYPSGNSSGIPSPLYSASGCSFGSSSDPPPSPLLGAGMSPFGNPFGGLDSIREDSTAGLNGNMMNQYEQLDRELEAERQRELHDRQQIELVSKAISTMIINSRRNSTGPSSGGQPRLDLDTLKGLLGLDNTPGQTTASFGRDTAASSLLGFGGSHGGAQQRSASVDYSATGDHLITNVHHHRLSHGDIGLLANQSLLSAAAASNAMGSFSTMGDPQQHQLATSNAGRAATTAPLSPYEVALDRLEREAKMRRSSAHQRDARFTWQGTLVTRFHESPTYASKVFVGGLPYDVAPETLTELFGRFGLQSVQFPPRGRGHAYLVFDSEAQVHTLLDACERKGPGQFYYWVSSRRGKDRRAQIIPWATEDSDWLALTDADTNAKKELTTVELSSSSAVSSCDGSDAALFDLACLSSASHSDDDESALTSGGSSSDVSPVPSSEAVVESLMATVVEAAAASVDGVAAVPNSTVEAKSDQEQMAGQHTGDAAAFNVATPRQNTIFVGALHGEITAEGLQKILSELFGEIIHVGIDTDKNRYPNGSARVTFANRQSFRQAVLAEFVHVITPRFSKTIQLDAYIEDGVCSECSFPTPVFCRHSDCFKYFCAMCFETHRRCQVEYHPPVMRNRNLPIPQNSWGTSGGVTYYAGDQQAAASKDRSQTL